MKAKFLAILAAAAMPLSGVGWFPPASAETTLKAVSAFPKGNIRTRQLLDYIKMVNEAGKGDVQIVHIGGPEVAPAPKQPIALRNGVVDIVSGPPAYYLGLFPDADALEGFKTAAQNRAMGGLAMLDKAARNKLGATVLARPGVGLGLYLFLQEPPKFTATGSVDLSGIKVRGSPAYTGFIKALGGTTVVIGFRGIYTAMERGVIDGVATGITTVRDLGLQKFVKYRIEPAFSVGSVLVIANAKKFDALSAKAKKIMHDAAVRWEEESMADIRKLEIEEKKKLATIGVQEVKLDAKQAAAYIETYMSKPWSRLRTNPKVEIDVDKARRAFY